jgi:asparagine synthase (glutamine-hydrolysing)
MCGVAGAVGLIDRDIIRAVRKMQAAQRHRGPDGAGLWQSAAEDRFVGVVLAHTRLAILDLTQAAAQPMMDPRSGAVIVYNGETYNFRDVRRDLERRGETFASRGDTEVVLKAVAQWGIRSVERFRGMFAFAVWDPRGGELHMARDRLGIKPLYMAVLTHRGDGMTVLFASELRALLASNLIEPRLDPAGVATYLWNGFVIGPLTILRDVHLLPAGSYVTIRAGHRPAAPVGFWHIPSGCRAPRDNSDQLGAELEAAVRGRMTADVPLGVFLSGGIDSSAVTAIATRTSPDAVQTFTVGFDRPGYDESRYARAVAEALRTRHQCVRVSEPLFRSLLPDALESIDQPTFDALNTYLISRVVREAGVTVALAGTGGDELFGGYRSFRDVPRAVAWGRRLAPVPEWALRSTAATLRRVVHGFNGGVPAQTRWGKLGDALVARGDLVKTYQVSYALFTEAFLAHLVTDRIVGDHVIDGLPEAAVGDLRSLTEGSSMLHAVSILELQSFIGQRLLRDTDAASMAVSLEVRLPLLDHRVVETVATIDDRHRFMPLQRKQLLRRLTLQGLDPALFERPKRGFVLPIDSWCRSGLHDQVDRVLRDGDLCRAVGVNPACVSRLWRAFEDSRPGLYWSRLWMLFILMWWCRRYNVSL